MSVPLFSVSIETYNQAEFIAQTLDSILYQDHSYPYEIVVADDLSSDNTREVLLDYQKRYPDIIKIIFNEKNLGVIKNYFNVLKACSGKYIIDCAGDDYWLPGRVRAQIAFMESHDDVAMCYGKAKSYYQDRAKLSKKSFGRRIKNFKDLIESNGIPALTVVFRKKYFNEYLDKVQPEKKSWLMEDYPLWLWLSLKSKIVYMPKVFCVYRVRSKSASHFDDWNKVEEFVGSVMDIRLWYAKEYPSLVSKNDLYDTMNKDLASYAILLGNDSLALSYLKKINRKTLKTLLRTLNCYRKVILTKVF